MRDTSESIAARYRRLLMELSPVERLRRGAAMFDGARAMVSAGIRDELGDGLNEMDLRREVLLRTYGEDLSPTVLAAVLNAFAPAAPQELDCSKCASIRQVVARVLRSAGRERVGLTDRWDADAYAVGFTGTATPGREVYVSTFQQARGRYSYACEDEAGTTVAAVDGVSFDELLTALRAHLRS